jgi:hypothetical protein
MRKKKSVSKKVSKSEAVRAYLKEHPDFMPVAVAEAMKEQGVDVTPAQVSTVKYNMQKTQKTRRRRRRKGAAVVAVVHAPKPVASNMLHEIKSALCLLKLAGSVKNAKAMLEVAQQIRELV